jgi:hypothetical protein
MDGDRLEFLTEGPPVIGGTLQDEAAMLSASPPGEHVAQLSLWPRKEARPSSVSTQGLSVQGGLCRTWRVWPQSKSATQSPYSSR